MTRPSKRELEREIIELKEEDEEDIEDMELWADFTYSDDPVDLPTGDSDEDEDDEDTDA